jgi:hypothetical protein
VSNERVELFERPGVEQQVDAFTGGQLAGFTLPPQPLLAAAELGAASQVGESRFRIHQSRLTLRPTHRDTATPR